MFVARSDIVVVLLPLTTLHGLVNALAFGWDDDEGFWQCKLLSVVLGRSSCTVSHFAEISKIIVDFRHHNTQHVNSRRLLTI